MDRGSFIPELPCERRIRKTCGSQWRTLPKPEIDAAWGVAIVQSILDGIQPDIRELSRHLGVDGDKVADAYRRLSLNGVLKRGLVEDDRPALESGDELAWGYYGGYASGAAYR